MGDKLDARNKHECWESDAVEQAEDADNAQDCRGKQRSRLLRKG